MIGTVDQLAGVATLRTWTVWVRIPPVLLMGKKSARYCVRATSEGWRIWNRKMKKWWGNPTKEFPSAILKRLNEGGDKSDMRY